VSGWPLTTTTQVFVPESLTIAKGDKVIWVNNKSFPHNVVFEEGDVPVRRGRIPCLMLQMVMNL